MSRHLMILVLCPLFLACGPIPVGLNDGGNNPDLRFVPANCSNNVQDGDETDVDCGGFCSPCAGGQRCSDGPDCAGGICVNRKCVDAACDDRVKNGKETDVDCGGGNCPPCAVGKMCADGPDCASNTCENGVCKQVIECMPPLANCDGNPMSGCNVDTSTDPTNCGACGNACPMGMRACRNGICVKASRLLLIGSHDTTLKDVQATVQSTGAFETVDWYDAQQKQVDVGLATMKTYDVILVLSCFKPEFGDSVADYFDAGGTVVTVANNRLKGRWVGDGYYLMEGGGGGYRTEHLGNYTEPNSPLLAGVKMLSFGNMLIGNVNLAPGAVVIAEWTVTKAAAVIRGRVKNRNRVELNWDPVSTKVNQGSWFGDGARLLQNALLYR